MKYQKSVLSGRELGYALKKGYGISLKEYTRMKESQNNTCLICGAPPSENKRLHVDHCHKSKKVRGLLCNFCNGGLGFFKDKIRSLRKAIAYLKGKPLLPIN